MKKADLATFAALVGMRSEILSRMNWYLKSADMLMGNVPWEEDHIFPPSYNHTHSSEEYLCAWDCMRESIRHIDAEILRLRLPPQKPRVFKRLVSAVAASIGAFLCGM